MRLPAAFDPIILNSIADGVKVLIRLISLQGFCRSLTLCCRVQLCTALRQLALDTNGDGVAAPAADPDAGEVVAVLPDTVAQWKALANLLTVLHQVFIFSLLFFASRR